MEDLRVYVASTFWELEDFRSAAERAIRRLGHQPEMLHRLDGLSDVEIVSLLRERVSECDAVIVIVGLGRGSVPQVPGLEALSFTRIEYDAASKGRLPLLVFHTNTESKPPRPGLPNETETRIRSENEWVDRFRRSQLQAHVVQRFEDMEEFEAAVTVAIAKLEAALRRDPPGTG
jgi:hypothetical protein